MSDDLQTGQYTALSENLYTVFRMDYNFSTREVEQYPRDPRAKRPRSSSHPASKSICSFLNTEGGNIYIGIDSDGAIRGIRLTTHMCIICPSKIKSVIKPNRHHPQKLKKVLEVVAIAWLDLMLRKALRYHVIGQERCDCENTIETMESNLYLVVIEVYKSPDGTIYQNEEGIAYRRRKCGSNKAIILNDIASAILSENSKGRT
ncbi:unnamed protein product [Nippostrongylus brasiliensis]|uniref:AlbA_2 domain-containing protein n=1 Tax=Nippostrongylus brasiliensis TaxID=27835 RepID=A0A0N4YGS7_NIPBR|nr:unnamed protein product [Nippostrongylus brasiliensis]